MDDVDLRFDIPSFHGCSLFGTCSVRFVLPILRPGDEGDRAGNRQICLKLRASIRLRS